MYTMVWGGGEGGVRQGRLYKNTLQIQNKAKEEVSEGP